MSSDLLGQMTLEQVKNLERINPILFGFSRRILIDTYEEFVNSLYEDIDFIINQIQEDSNLYQKDSGEDRITVEIKKILVAQGYDASHDENHGGHPDLLVKMNGFKWICEAKKHSGYDYLWKGFQQLCTRYSNGDSKEQDGGMLIYVFISNVSQVMEKWQDRLAKNQQTSISLEPCPRRALSFFSTHIHEKSGLPFRVRHMPLILYFDPKDK